MQYYVCGLTTDTKMSPHNLENFSYYILDGEGFSDYINYLSERAEHAPGLDQVERKLIIGCRKEVELYLTQDEKDGRLIVDYLRDRREKMLEQDIVHSAAKRLKTFLENHTLDREQQERLEYLKAYFTKRGCWIH